MITLGWVNSGLERWKTLVANRVAQIQNNRIDVWRHVRSEENPANCASRGINPSELNMEHIWFTGPKCLKNDSETWETINVPEPTLKSRNIKRQLAQSIIIMGQIGANNCLLPQILIS